MYLLNAYSKRVAEAAPLPAIADHPCGEALVIGLASSRP